MAVAQKLRYEDLNHLQFEDIVVCLCQDLLGPGTQCFSTGPDGGRDARFHGTASLLPSPNRPWEGKTIVQAKHTLGVNKTFLDPDFHSSNGKSAIVNKELKRIKKLFDRGELDNYLLVSNRRLAGNAEEKVRVAITKYVGLSEQSVLIAGTEQLDMWLKSFPGALECASIDPVDGPLLVDPNDLAEVVLAVSESLSNKHLSDLPPPATRIPFKVKNKINHLSTEYATSLTRNYLKYTRDIDDFLSDPSNDEIIARYSTSAEEFQLRLLSKRKDYQTFDEVMEYLTKFLFDRDTILSKKKRLTRAVLFYMYWKCDIGNETDDTT